MKTQDIADLKGELKILREQIANGSITGALETVKLLEDRLELLRQRILDEAVNGGGAQSETPASSPPPTVPEGNG